MMLRHLPGSYRPQAALLAAVFATFLANALGLADFSQLAAGRVAVNQQVLADLLDGSLAPSLLRPDLAAFGLVGVALVAALPALPPIAASALTLGMMAPPFAVAWLFPQPPPLVPLDYTLVTILVLFAASVLMGYFAETHRRRRILDVFGQYVPPQLVDVLSRDPDALSMAGEAREMTVLFSDIKRFTTISEQLEPRVLADMLNQYLTEITAVLHRHDATIDKYIGDAVMAFWGAPLRQDDHAARAVAAALDMQRHMHTLRERFARRGWPVLEIGIGIATGVVSVGNMGSRYRVAYTVIGDAVNLAARLEALTRQYEVDVLVSEATSAAAATHRFREIDHVRVKGRGNAGRIFEPLDDAPDALSDRERDALARWYAGDWPGAAAGFAALAADDPACGWYGVMHARAAGREAPPGWDGVTGYGSAARTDATAARG